MKQEIVSKRPLIIVKTYTKYAHVSMDASMDSTWWSEERHPITDRGEAILQAYLTSLIPDMKTNTWFGAGRYSNVTVRKEIVADVIKKFKEVYQHNHRTVTNLDILHAAETGEMV